MNKPARRRSSYKNIEDQQQQQSTTSAIPSSSSATNTTSENQNNGDGNAMDGAHRKIELQSPEDLTFLINNVRRAAEEHVNAAFPPVDDGPDDVDELRVRIEKLVADVCFLNHHSTSHTLSLSRQLEDEQTADQRATPNPQYISQTFTLAAPNLSINGFDLDPKTFPAVYLDLPSNSPASSHNLRRRGGRSANTEPEEIVQYEAFDARRRARVEELAREEEDLMREIAALKRRVPGAAAKGFADGFWEGVRADEEALERARADAVAAGAAAGDEQEDRDDEEEEAEGEKKKSKAMLGGIGPLERQADVEAGYGGVVEALGRMRREMPATVAKMERARVAGEYVVTER